LKIYGEYSIIQGIESLKEILLLLAGTAALLQAAGRCLFAVVFPCRAATLLQVAAARLSADVFPWLRAGGWYL
jgi:hypothetical protein